MTIIELDNNNIMSQRGIILLVLIFLTVVGHKSVYIKASGDDFMQYSDAWHLLGNMDKVNAT